jgi:hypothetical protein
VSFTQSFNSFCPLGIDKHLLSIVFPKVKMLLRRST